MKTIKYISFDDTSGYSISAKAMVSALERDGAIVHWTSFGLGASAYDPSSIPQIRSGYKNVIIHTVPEYYPFWREAELAQKTDVKKIWGYTTWETDKIPGHWPDLLNKMDGIIVPCHWNKEVFRECGVRSRIEVVPHVSQFQGCEPAVAPSPAMKLLEDRLEGKVVFYSIGVWSDRKAPWLLIRAFLSEFGPDEPVVLVLKTGKYDITNLRRSWKRPWRLTQVRAVAVSGKIIASVAKAPEVIHLDYEMSDSDMAWLHKMGDCFVSLARGEGWGMGAYEAAWWGKPVITTGIGGVLDYLPASLSYHVNYELIPVRCKKGWESYTVDQRWAEPDPAHARKLMRQVYENRKEAEAKGLQLKESMALNFNASLIARSCLDMLAPE